jgi:superfamily II DNA or RNA helicase
VHSAEWRLAVVPRKWQADALAAWEVAQRGVVSVVTGAGKTLFAQMCILSAQRKCADLRVVIVAPTVALVDQWYVSMREDLGVAADEIALFSGQHTRAAFARVNLMVINTARELGFQAASDAPCLLVVDECHRAGSPVNSQSLDGKYIAMLGLSATPVREYDTGFECRVAPVLGPVIYEYGYSDALRDGVVAPFSLVNVRVDMSADEKQQYRKLSDSIARLTRKSLPGPTAQVSLRRALLRRAAVTATVQMRIPVAAKLVLRHKADRCLVFHERIAAANRLVKVLLAHGMNVALYHTKIGENIRRENLRLFRRGIYDCLVTCRALDEGTNVPESRVAVIASSTRSTRQRIQRLGRVLRPAPGKQSATIYTIYATDSEEERLHAEARNLQGASEVTWMRGRLA